MAIRLGRGKPDTTIPDSDRRYTVNRGGSNHRVPRNLAVVVSVDVHKPWRDDEPISVNDSRARCGDVADRADTDNSVPLNRDVPYIRRSAYAVNNRAVTNNKISHAAQVTHDS